MKSRRSLSIRLLAGLLVPRTPDDSATPWQMTIANIALNAGSVAFDDRVSGLAPALKDIALKASDITGDFSKTVPFEISAAIVSGGTLGARGNDTYLTGRVKAAFVTAQKFSATHVKVVTESGVVYLLGLVNRNEAANATEIARTTSSDAFEPGVVSATRLRSVLKS